MKFITASAIGALLILSTSPAFSWGSITRSISTGEVDFNAHGCIDETAYEMLSGGHEFPGANFPTIEAINDFEGVEKTALNGLQGHGPDADNATYFSEHYYNPETDEGNAPKSVGEWFEKLTRGTTKPQSAAWSAHFLADLSVPYHVNGQFGADLEKDFTNRNGPSPEYMPYPNVTGEQRDSLNHPVAGSSFHNWNFALEANRYLAAAKGSPKLDWFDPWYWNGSAVAPTVSSSHLVWEGWITKCPSSMPAYSSLWPGNPTPSWHHNISKMRDVVVSFAKKIALNTRNSAYKFINNSDDGEMQAAESIATIWRASFTGLRVDMTYVLDPTTVANTPTVNVHGKVGNFVRETASGVQLQLVKASGSCTVEGKPDEAVQILGDLPGGGTVRQFGDWRVYVPQPNNCRLLIGVIGGFKKTPDLQLGYAYKDVTITIPQVKENKPKPPVTPVTSVKSAPKNPEPCDPFAGDEDCTVRPDGGIYAKH